MEMADGMQMKMNHVIMKHLCKPLEMSFHKKLCGLIILMNYVNAYRKHLLNLHLRELKTNSVRN